MARSTGRALRRHPFAILSILLLAVPLLAAAYVLRQVPHTPSVGDLKRVKAEQPSVLMSSDGKELAVFRKANREWVPLAAIAPAVRTALLDTEDHRFYEHRGLDWRRTLAAAYNTLGGRLQGGSTITQQLARNLYPEEIGRSVTIDRKIKEAITALKIESVYSKDEILEIYLNTVPFLYNAYGIEMAARTYFDKSARELDLLESATLVGMLKGTSYYNPVLNPKRAQQRRNTVLAQMARHGHLDAQQLVQLQARPMRLDFERQDEQLGPAPHFAVMMRRWLIDWADRNGYNIHADGLVVHTTLDTRAQLAAQQAVNRQLERLQRQADAVWGGRQGWDAQRGLVDTFIRESAQFQAARAAGQSEAEALAALRSDTQFMQALRQDKLRLQAGLVAIEPGTGWVRAWVGSSDFAVDQYDHVQQARRQPGSTFKPFVYGAAFDMGARPGDQLIDQPVEIQVTADEVWRPTDNSAPTLQPYTLRDALAQSKNTITAQVVQRIGIDRVAQLAQAMGVRDSRLQAVPSLALGTSPVTLKEMVTAYGTIANGGRHVAPGVVLRVEDRQGRVLEAFRPAEPEDALAPVPNALLLDAMRAAIDQGTGAPIRTRFGLQGELAGKTGTSQDNTDGWFILMHPQLVSGAWVGYNDSRLVMQDAWGQGARSALPMVGDFMQQSLRGRLLDPRAKFPRPREMPPAESGPWWGSLFPPLVRPADPAAAAAAIPESMDALPPGDARQGMPQPAIVVAPPWASRPVERAVVASPRGEVSERAIVVAPPRAPGAPPAQSPPGQASGAGALPSAY
jgi:penicillin-binding protein 1A